MKKSLIEDIAVILIVAAFITAVCVLKMPKHFSYVSEYGSVYTVTGGGISVSSDGYVTIDINNADAALLMSLPGIGEKTAAAIIAEREANGPFTDADDLVRVKGIGEKTVEAIRALISAG